MAIQIQQRRCKRMNTTILGTFLYLLLLLRGSEAFQIQSYTSPRLCAPVPSIQRPRATALQSQPNSAGLSHAPDPVVQESVRVLKRASWFSWWSQLILTTISSVILVFAKTSTQTPAIRNHSSLFLSGTGLLVSGCSIVWTWGNRSRLSKRLLNKPATFLQARQMLLRAVRVGISINLLGLLLHLLAAQQIIGSLAIQVLSNSNLLQGGLQPLDVLIVQANTNALLSQYCSLVSLLYVTQTVLPKLGLMSNGDAGQK